MYAVSDPLSDGLMVGGSFTYGPLGATGSFGTGAAAQSAAGAPSNIAGIQGLTLTNPAVLIVLIALAIVIFRR
jgi:hypothetical protein